MNVFQALKKDINSSPLWQPTKKKYKIFLLRATDVIGVTLSLLITTAETDAKKKLLAKNRLK